MRNRFGRINYVFHFLGYLLDTLGVVFLFPLFFVFSSWGRGGEGQVTLLAFLVPSAAAFVGGRLLRRFFRAESPDTTGSMIICGLSWLIASAVGALPFVIGLGSGYLNAYFEAMSGFTTTGITILQGLDSLPRSVLFWRALTQWVGGVGILSFFLVITFRGTGSHHVFGAESHKIAATRPAPGIFHTLKILWGIYAAFTGASAVILSLEGLPVFDAVCHSLTALSTGGFSPHDSSIAYYALGGHPNFRLIEYTLTFFMILGGVNFLIHYRVINRDFKALWDNLEIRYWWRLVAAFTVLIMIDHYRKHGISLDLAGIEQVFRHSIFQVTAILTTTGFSTQDISSDFFSTLARQLFLAMMVIGGCVGSTGGGIKVMRVVILWRLMLLEVFKIRVPGRAATGLVIDGRPVPYEESRRTAALFFTWIALLVIGGGVTALLSDLGSLESFSGMCSALGNIGPCYISVQEMIGLTPVVKIVYIFGMLAGRLEILPVILLFSRKAWRG
jgi:trk system potassium uptake protein TrkH